MPKLKKILSNFQTMCYREIYSQIANIDATDTGPSGELSSNDESKEEKVENSGVASLQSKDFAQALQAHSLLMVGIFIIVKICATKFCAPW